MDSFLTKIDIKLGAKIKTTIDIIKEIKAITFKMA